SLAWLRRSQVFAPPESEYEILFEDVNGLKEGDPVTVRGYEMGRVLRIEPGNIAVRVRIALEKGFPLYQDTRAEIQVKELMGGKQITLYPGSREPQLAAGGLLEGSNSLDFSSSFSRAGQMMNQIEPAQFMLLASRLDSFTQVLLRIGAAVDPDIVRSSLTQLSQTTGSLSRMAQQAESGRYLQQADSLLDESRHLLAQLNGLSNETRQRLPAADTLATQISSLLLRSEAMLTSADAMMQKVQQNQGMAGRLLYDPGMAQTLDSTLRNLNLALEKLHSGRVVVGLRAAKKK
ncbi:MAG: MCE family protein, partial [Bacteroidetes bacterium]